MKKAKQIIIAIIIIISIAIVSYGSYLLGANQVTYDKNGEEISVESALDELYEMANHSTQTATTTADGGWSDSEGINTPNLVTGLTPVTFDTDGSIIELEVTDYANWYDYQNAKWANAITKDSNNNITGYWVWIPRFEYKINASTETTTVKFIPTSQTTVDEGYDHVHPAFCDGSSTHFMNGEWNKELPGFWVAKFPAGYQRSTITATNNGTLSTTYSNSSSTLVSSTVNYSYVNSTYKSTPAGNISTSTKMSLPVFLPLTYAYNCITIGDSYTLAQQISKSNSFYGLGEETYSHMLKNSEWGAIAYLTQSQYGLNGAKPNKNNYYNYTSSPYLTNITGIYTDGASPTNSTNQLSTMKAWYSATGKRGSSTENETGVYDLNGCNYQFVAGYISNGSSPLTTYKGSSNWVTTRANANGYKTLSTKYYTVYPYNSSSDTSDDNWTRYNSLKSSTYGYGDAILEISSSGNSYGWNREICRYPSTTYNPFFARSGGHGSTGTGAICFDLRDGNQSAYNGFRAVLCP